MIPLIILSSLQIRFSTEVVVVVKIQEICWCSIEGQVKLLNIKNEVS